MFIIDRYRLVSNGAPMPTGAGAGADQRVPAYSPIGRGAGLPAR